MQYRTPVLINRYKSKDFDVYIGRGTKWGNPFPINEACGQTRLIVIEMYRHQMYEWLENGTITVQDILDLSGKTIACSCAPKACHGDIIIEVFNEIVSMMNAGT